MMSAIFLTPTRDLHTAELTCRAEVVNMTGYVQDTTRLNVKCRLSISQLHISKFYIFCQKDGPTVTMRTPLELEDIREGHDVYFSCQVDSNPPPKHISWIYNVGSY